MSWGMPSTGQWNAPVGMAPDMSMGSLTPEQWAAIQQQNWQQWAQWHQQYTQWQSQYGEKYAEQMQAYQSMGKMPPLPPTNAAPPPAPPPPDKPPPPPHENNQPLFGQTGAGPQNQIQPAPVPPPHQSQPRNTGGYSNVKPQMVEQNRPGQSNSKIEPSSNIDADALNKLAEEEKLFDIQFQKWEQEIEKWRKENINHPDKEAYKEYEQKFETCRAQLMERRQQMKLKRAKLLGNTQTPQQQLPNNTITGSQPAHKSNNKNNFGHDTKPQNYQNQNYQNQNRQPQQYMPQNNSSYPNHQHGGQSSYNRNSNNIVVQRDPYNSYETMNDDMNKYSSPNTQLPQFDDNSDFMPKPSSDKGIPGLDLVTAVERNTATSQEGDVIDINEDHEEEVPQQSPFQKPDYSTISRGINSILGDEKIMNILSMVRGNTMANMMPPSNNNQHIHQANDPYYNDKNNFAQNQQHDKYQQNYNNQPPNNRQNVPYDREDQNYPPQQQDFNPKYPPMKRIQDERQPNMMQEQYYDRNFQPNIPNIRPPPMGNVPLRSGPPPSMQPDGKSNRIPALLELPVNHNMNNYSKGPIETDVRQLPPGNNVTQEEHHPPQPKWVEEPLFTPSIIVEYEHKPLRLKARDFIEPVHIFEYNHKSKDEDIKKKDFEKEADEVFLRKPRRDRDEEYGAYPKYRADYYNTEFERRAIKEDFRSDFRPNPREDFERRRIDDRFDDRRRDDRDKYIRRDDIRDNRDRERERERYRDYRRDDSKNRSRSRDRDSRKREHNRDESITFSKKPKEHNAPPTSSSKDNAKHIVMIDDLLEPPGRDIRPEKIVIILRGPPGSGKSYLAKTIRDKEAEHGGAARILSIDDYFMQEGEVEEKDPATGKTIKKPTLKYEYDEKLEESYMNSLKRAFKRTLTDGYFSFLIFDAVNDQLKHYADVWNSARQCGFQVYICTMDLDPNVCFKRNIHNRTLEDIEAICSRFFPTPTHHIQLDPTTLLQNAAIPEVHMEDVENDVVMDDAEDPEVESVFTSKWEKMDDAAQLARLDGTSKPLRPSQLSMEDYLQLDDWTPNAPEPGKKTVRWADLEERRQQEKIRAIGFVVGQTDWNRMTDPTMGSGALTQTKYIERVRRT